MANHAKRPLVDEAVQDIFHRTLQGISDDFGRADLYRFHA